MSSPWLVLLFSGLLETAWAVGLRYTEGFTRLWPSVLTVACMAGSFYGLSIALRALPIGTAYAVWTGIGAAGTFIYGVFALGEPATAGRIVCVLLILAGIAGLKLLL